jgi:hypothetical protein
MNGATPSPPAAAGRPSSVPRPGGRRLAALALMAVVAATAGMTAEDASRLEARRRRVEGMTQVDLNRLKRNYERFRQLSPAQRDAMFRLHEALEVDAKTGGHLQKLLEEYNRWFSGLSPFDRDALLSIADPVERAKRVEAIFEDHKQQRLARARAEELPFLAARTGRFGADAPLEPAELDVVVAAIEKNFLNDESRRRINADIKGRDRHLQVLKLAMQQSRTGGVPGGGVRRGPQAGDRALVAAIADAIPEGRRKARLGAARPQAPRRLGALLGRSLLAEWSPEIEAAPVKNEQIEAFFQNRRGVDPEELKKRLNSPDRRILELQVSLATNPELTEVAPVVNWLLRGFNDRRPPGSPRGPAARQRQAVTPG